MRVLTVSEFMEMVKGEVYNISSIDSYWVHIDMTKARIEFEKDFDEITFTSGNHNNGGIASVSFHVGECVEQIEFYEEDNIFMIHFNDNMADVEIRKAV